MSPMGPLVWASGLAFQLLNGIGIGGWLGGFGPTTQEEWTGAAPRIEVGMMVWALGLMLNMWHDDELREIRRAAARDQKKRKNAKDGDEKDSKRVDKVYMIPQNGLFRVVLYPHYLVEWIEWCGFWIVGGLACFPARTFVMNEIATMLPRAWQGKRWYLERFGKERVEGRQAVIPWVI